MYVETYDGKRIEVKDQEEAIKVATDSLKPWMQEGDYVAYAHSSYLSYSLREAPDIAYVMNENEEPCDAQAIIFS